MDPIEDNPAYRKRAESEGVKAAMVSLPLAQVTSIFAILAVYFTSISQPYQLRELLVLGAMLAVAVIWFMSYRKDMSCELFEPKIVMKHMALAGLVAGCYTTILAFIYLHTAGMESLLLGGMAAGLQGGGALCLAKAPKIALTWTWVISAGLIVSLLIHPGTLVRIDILLLLVYSLFIVRMIHYISNLFIERFLIQIRLDEQNQSIGRILDDLEAKAGEWLWETGQDGVITAVSDKLCQITGKKQDELIGLHCVKVLADTFVHVEDMIKEKQQAEIASKMKSQLVANVSHEIRTPLNAMMGFLQLLVQTEMTQEQEDYLSRLYEASKNLLGTIDNILDFSKIEEGKIELEMIPFSLRKAVEDAVVMFKPLAADKDVEICLTIEEGLPELVLGDPVRVSQILNNLLSNAVKFTEKGRIEVNLSRYAKEEQANTVMCTVRDTGIGMNRDTIDHLFQPFVQADSSITRRYGGTGLGLAITEELVKRMGGIIDVTSEPGKGSCFMVRLVMPAGNENLFRDRSPRDLTRVQTAGLAERGLKVLVVEDNSLNQRFIVTALEKLRMVCDTAADGALAVEKAEKSRYDLILMDCQLPVLDGYTAAEQIRTLRGPNGQVPILALTAGAAEEDRNRSLQAGMNDYLTKPVRLRDLYEKIFQITEGWEPLQEGAPGYEQAVERLVRQMHFTQEEAQSLLDEFILIIPDFMEKMEQTEKNGDYLQLAALAHQMKGLCCNLRLCPIQIAAAQLEAAAKAESQEALRRTSNLKKILIKYSEEKRKCLHD